MAQHARQGPRPSLADPVALTLQPNGPIDGDPMRWSCDPTTILHAEATAMSRPLIMIAVDVTTEPTGPCKAGTEVARRMGADVLLLCVSELPPGIRADTVIETEPGDGGKPVAEILSREVLALAEEHLQWVRSQGVEAQLWHRFGNVVDTITGCASRRNAFMLVVGSDVRAGLSRIFGPGITESIIRASPCPVLVVPRPDDAPLRGKGRVQSQVGAEVDG